MIESQDKFDFGRLAKVEEQKQVEKCPKYRFCDDLVYLRNFLMDICCTLREEVMSSVPHEEQIRKQLYDWASQNYALYERVKKEHNNVLSSKIDLWKFSPAQRVLYLIRQIGEHNRFMILRVGYVIKPGKGKKKLLIVSDCDFKQLKEKANKLHEKKEKNLI